MLYSQRMVTFLDLTPVSSQPIACTLSADAGREQVERWRDFSEEFAIAREVTPTHHTLRYIRSEESVRRLRALVEVESSCCSFVGWQVEDSGTELRLVISGSPEQLAALDIGRVLRQ